jgi:misacylated tRNA(Ala) deacylase
MRTHSAMLVLCGVIWRDYRAQVTGGNREPLFGRMNSEFEKMSSDLVREIEVKVNFEIRCSKKNN